MSILSDLRKSKQKAPRTSLGRRIHRSNKTSSEFNNKLRAAAMERRAKPRNQGSLKRHTKIALRINEAKKLGWIQTKPIAACHPLT